MESATLAVVTVSIFFFFLSVHLYLEVLAPTYLHQTAGMMAYLSQSNNKTRELLNARVFWHCQARVERSNARYFREAIFYYCYISARYCEYRASLVEALSCLRIMYFILSL